MEDLIDCPVTTCGVESGSSKRLCPLCGAVAVQMVKDTRPAKLFDGTPSLRRRRLCGACGERYTTYEVMEGHVVNGQTELRKSLIALERTVELLKSIIRER